MTEMKTGTNFARLISSELDMPEKNVAAVINLLKDGGTIPFIARYRKEMSGNMDEVAVRNVASLLKGWEELESRKHYILGVIESQGKLTDDLRDSIAACASMDILEDLYLPYKQKRKTRAQAAREKGLEPLALAILQAKKGDSRNIASSFVDKEKGVEDEDAAISGAMDIVAEMISEDRELRSILRESLEKKCTAETKVKKEFKDKRTKFEQYYDHRADISREPSHRILAMRRGSDEGVISLSFENPAEDEFKRTVAIRYNKKESPFHGELSSCIDDAYARLLFPSVSNDVWRKSLLKAEKDAIDLFSRNLENLLLAPPAGRKVILGVDPGFRTGCKLAVVGDSSDFLGYDVIYPNEPRFETEKSLDVLKKIAQKFSVQLVAVGNGTASRETVKILKDAFSEMKIPIVTVSESGASIYSASEIAAKEFPDLDLTVRSAINIARRLQDPLAELVKIDPCSIGVGQYQHDVDQKNLKEALGESVISCVSRVGVDANTASTELLSYIAGVGNSLAKKIVKKRSEMKGFRSRSDLLKVSGMGEKAFEQCAAFMRVTTSANPLDNSAIHPESYSVVERIASDMKIPVAELIGNADLVSCIDKKKYSDAGEYTLSDILDELKKPGRDPRKEFSYADFADGVNDMRDLKAGMVLNGIVTNVTGFGAFVDIGVHQDGLIHISNLSDRFVKDPMEVVSPGDKVLVEVISVDTEMKRIGLKRKFS